MHHADSNLPDAGTGSENDASAPDPVAALYRALAGELELEPIAGKVLKAALRVSGADSARLQLPRDNGPAMCVAARLVGGRLELISLPPTPLLLGAEQRLLIDSNGDIQLSLLHRREPVGVIRLTGAPPHPDRLELLQRLAEPAAAALAAALRMERLRREADRYSHVVNSAMEGVWQIDERDLTVYVNPRLAEMLDYRIEQMLGQPILAFVHPEDRDAFHRVLQQHRRGERLRCDMRFRRRDGSDLWVLLAAQPIFAADGRYSGAFALLVDIAERRRAELALRHSEEKYRLLVETSRDLIWYMDLDGRYTFLNPAAQTIFGYSPEEMLGRRFTDFQDPEAADNCWQVFERMRNGEPFERYETVHRRKDGALVFLSFNAVAVRDEQGRVVGVTGTATDISELKRTEEALRSSEEQLRQVLEQLPAAVWTTDTELVITSSRGSARGVIGAHAERLVGRRLTDTVLARGNDPLVELSRQALRGGGGAFEEERRGRLFHTRVQPLRNAAGDIVGTLGIALDITKQRRSEEALQQERERAQVTLEAIADGVITTDTAGRVRYLNPAAEALCGWRMAEAQGRPLAEVLRLEDERSGERCPCPAAEVLTRNDAVKLSRECRLRRRDGSTLAVEHNATPIRGIHGETVGVVVAFHDVSASRLLAAQLSHRATHDPLTELPNRELFVDRLEQAIASARRHHQRLAVLFLDLDRFKEINDTLGHPVGDQLLREVAARLCGCVRRNDTVGRLGGDEFVVLLAEVDRPEHVTEVAQKMLVSLAQPYCIGDHELHVTTSIGISVYPDDGRTSTALIKHADVAMYHAKENGRNSYQFFTESMNQRALERTYLEHSLRRALERDELTLYYQPQIALPSGEIVGAEALLRWRHPERGLIPPTAFIPIAEDSGLILPIGEWVIRHACLDAQTWRSAGGAPPRVAVNVSTLQFRHRDIVNVVRRALAQSGLAAQRLELELTESVVMHDPEQTAQRLRELKQLGVRVVLDDFGTGYTSLGHLRRLPVDSLKIDRSFVRSAHIDADAGAVVQAVIRLGHSLRLAVLAEGVEREAGLAFLSDRQCDSAQGFLIGEPQPAERFGALLAAHRGGASTS